MSGKIQISEVDLNYIVLKLREYKEMHDNVSQIQEVYQLYALLVKLGIKLDKLEMPRPPKKRLFISRLS